MNRIKLTIFAIVCAWATTLHGQLISKPEARSLLLEGMKRTLSNLEQDAGSYERVRSPFIPVMPEKEEVVVEKVEEVFQPRAAERLPDNQALGIISEQFKPLGSLILGDRGVLQLQDNSTIEKGSIFNAEINGNTYPVHILDVTSRGYTLRLGSAQITKNFLTTSGTAQ